MSRVSSAEVPADSGALSVDPISVLPAGSEYLVQLGWTRAEARAWLGDSALLAALPRGQWARCAIAELPDAGDDPRERATALMRASAYRELEAVERLKRSDFLLALAARLSRRAASLGSAGLALLIPSAASGSESLELQMAREGRRSQSRRLARALRAAAAFEGIEVDAENAQSSTPLSQRELSSDGPASVARWLIRLARRLRSSDRVEMTAAEVELAFEGGAPARTTLARIGFTQAIEHGERTDGGSEAALEDRAARVLVLADFLDGRTEAALRRLNAIPLLLDRTASAGTLRAVAESRGRVGRGASELCRDEFVAPLGADERRRIARFLAFAHGTPR
ncbi:MAG: hypothetical protein AAGG01_08720 [Planctomycetota bacterium]